MAGFDHTILTDVGLDALTDAEAGQHIDYVHFEAGDGYAYGGDAELQGLTALKHKVMDFPITSFSNDGNGQLTLIGVISSKNVTTGFSLREIGVKCTIDGGPEILYAVSNAGDTADYIPGSSETSVVIQNIQVIIKIDRATNVTVVVQPGLDVTCANIGPGTAGAGWFRDKIGQICWFKRVKSPKGTIEVTETSDLITIDIPTVEPTDEDLTLYVAIGNPDIYPNFSTIQKALDYLIPKQIRAGRLATINVLPGVWTNMDVTTVNHPQSPQIKIIGSIGTPRTVTSASGSLSAVTLNGTNVGADLAAGDFFLFQNTSQQSGRAVSGCWAVASRATNSVTFSANWNGSGGPTVASITSGTVTPLKSVYKTKANVGGIDFKGFGIGLLKYLCFAGNSPANGTEGIRALNGISFVESCGSRNYNEGFDAQLSGRMNCLNCGASDNNVGFQAGWGGIIEVTTGFANSNSQKGLLAEGGWIRAFGVTCCGNGDQGLIASANGQSLITEILSGWNGQDGIRAQYNGSITTAGGSLVSGSNGDDDIALSVLSSILRTGGAAIQYGSSNIAPNMLSNDGCWFTP